MVSIRIQVRQAGRKDYNPAALAVNLGTSRAGRMNYNLARFNPGKSPLERTTIRLPLLSEAVLKKAEMGGNWERSGK